MNLPPLPRWFWLLPVVALAAWWPIDPWWQSDDYFALHYVQDGSAVLRDFVGPQYGATGVWSFYRPLITASFWFEHLLAGASPLLSHASNAAAHALSALLLALIWRRFLGTGAAWLAGLCWAVSPTHVGAIAWAAGRVDSHSTVWCLLAVWCALRAQERRVGAGRGAQWPTALATLAALASKEAAIVVPTLATLCLAVREQAPSATARLRAGLRGAAGSWLVLLLWLPFRWLVLGKLGGYAAAAFDPVATTTGFGKGLLDFASPGRWIGPPPALADAPSLWLLAGGAPVALGLLLGCWRRPRLALGAAIAAAFAFVPIASMLAGAHNPQTLRYWYLPTAALCGVLAAGGPAVVAAVLLAWAGPLVLMRGEQHAADGQSATLHRAVLAAATERPPPLFVAGLPHANARGTVIQLHFGVDRLLAPPFTERVVPLYALRPLASGPEVFTLAGEPPFPLPRGATIEVVDSGWRDVAATPQLPELPIAGDRDGVVDLTTPELERWVAHGEQWLQTGGGPRLDLPGVRAPHLRVTVFTASGYVTAVCEEHGAAGAADGALSLVAWIVQDKARPLRIGHTSPASYIGDALVVPTVVDLVPEFPVLVEAGSIDLASFRFTPTWRARRLLTFRFDRGYAAWVDRVQGR